MLSYHNDVAVKEKYVSRFAEHRAIDAVIQGEGYNGQGKGCFVGCTLKNYDHSQFPVELGWPEWLAHLADKIFEGLPKEDAPQFGTDLLNAVPVGVDLEPVKWKLAIWRHTNQIEQLKDNNEPYAIQCKDAVKQVIDYCTKQLNKEFESESAARSAAESAWSAAESAWSAAESAWSAAESAESAAESAESAAWSAWSAARSAAWDAAYKSEKDALLSFIRELG